MADYKIRLEENEMELVIDALKASAKAQRWAARQAEESGLGWAGRALKDRAAQAEALARDLEEMPF